METDIKFDETNQRAELKLGGNLMIQDASKLKDVLSGFLSSADDCILDLDEVQLFDLSSIQLLFALHLTAKKLDKQLSLKGDCPQLFREAVESAGLSWTKWLCFGGAD